MFGKKALDLRRKAGDLDTIEIGRRPGALDLLAAKQRIALGAVAVLLDESDGRTLNAIREIGHERISRSVRDHDLAGGPVPFTVIWSRFSTPLSVVTS